MRSSGCIIHFKNERGFTILEVMFALVIVGLVLAPALAMQFNLVRKIITTAGRSERFGLAKNFVVIVHEQQVADPTIKQSNRTELVPPTTLNYQLKSIENNPALAQLPGLHIEVVEISWTSLVGKQHDQLVTFLFRPELNDTQTKK